MGELNVSFLVEFLKEYFYIFFINMRAELFCWLVVALEVGRLMDKHDFK